MTRFLPPHRQAGRAPPPQPVPPPAPPATVADCHARLAELDRERAELQTALAAFPVRELRLVHEDQGFEAFDDLDAERKQKERRLVKLDIDERALVNQAAILDEQDFDQGLRAAVVVYRNAVARYSEVAHEAIRAREILRTAIGGLERFGLRFQPAALDRLDTGELHRHAEAAAAIPDRPVTARPSPTFTVLFLRPYEMYVTGDVAGLSAKEASSVCAAGAAMLCDRRQVLPPPRPDPRTVPPPPPDSAGRNTVRFIRPWQENPADPAHRPGSVATVPAAIARSLVAHGNAEFIVEGG